MKVGLRSIELMRLRNLSMMKKYAMINLSNLLNCIKYASKRAKAELELYANPSLMKDTRNLPALLGISMLDPTPAFPPIHCL